MGGFKGNMKFIGKKYLVILIGYFLVVDIFVIVYLLDILIYKEEGCFFIFFFKNKIKNFYVIFFLK